VVILLLVGEREVKEATRKATAELMGTMEMNLRHQSKASPGQGHLNLHQALTFGGNPCVHKGFLIPAKREIL